MFCSKLKTAVPLVEILDIILNYYPCKTSGLALFVINIDETNALLMTGHHKFLQGIVKAVVDANIAQRFVFPVLTGTHAVELFNSLELSGTQRKDIPLTLLTVKQAEDIIMDLANRGQVG